MVELSLPLELIIHIATIEAISLKHKFVEPGHLFIGICSIDKLLDPGTKKELKMSDTVASELRVEWKLISSVLEKYKLDMTDLRQEIRNVMGTGKFDHQTTPIERSSESQKAIERAQQIAEAANGIVTDPIHLLAALLENQKGVPVRILKSKGIIVENCKQSVNDLIIQKSKEYIQFEQEETLYESFLEQLGRDFMKLLLEEKLSETMGEQAREGMLPGIGAIHDRIIAETKLNEISQKYDEAKKEIEILHHKVKELLPSQTDEIKRNVFFIRPMREVQTKDDIDYDLMSDKFQEICDKFSLNFIDPKSEIGPRPIPIITVIEKYLRESRLVIADISEVTNPNVYYEVGFVKGLSPKKLILLCEESVELPFDISAHWVLKYISNPRGFENLLKQVERIIKKILDDEEKK